jgi:hypothetical protein
LVRFDWRQVALSSALTYWRPFGTLLHRAPRKAGLGMEADNVKPQSKSGLLIVAANEKN